MTRSIPARAIDGAVSGLVATIPMTVAMILIQRLLPWTDRLTLEPRRISDDMLDRSGVEPHLPEQAQKQVSLVAHFGYGAATGVAYGIADDYLPVPRGLRGPIYGLLVWAASYAGWLPAIGMLPPPHRRPLGRNLLLIVAHLVWGVAAEQTERLLRGLPSGTRQV
jgi:hypothetical protein